MSNVYGKSEGRIGKFCLFLKALEGNDSTEISSDIMKKAISLNNYFNNQVFGLYSELTNSVELAPQLVKVLEIVEKQNGFVSARDIIQAWSNRKQLPKTQDVLGWFNQLVGLKKGSLNKIGKKYYFSATVEESVERVEDLLKPSSTVLKHIEKEFQPSVESVEDFFDSQKISFDLTSTQSLKMDETIINKDIEDNLTIMGASGANLETEKSSTQKPEHPPTMEKNISYKESSTSSTVEPKPYQPPVKEVLKPSSTESSTVEKSLTESSTVEKSTNEVTYNDKQCNINASEGDLSQLEPQNFLDLSVAEQIEILTHISHSDFSKLIIIVKTLSVASEMKVNYSGEIFDLIVDLNTHLKLDFARATELQKLWLSVKANLKNTTRRST